MGRGSWPHDMTLHYQLDARALESDPGALNQKVTELRINRHADFAQTKKRGGKRFRRVPDIEIGDYFYEVGMISRKNSHGVLSGGHRVACRCHLQPQLRRNKRLARPIIQMGCFPLSSQTFFALEPWRRSGQSANPWRLYPEAWRPLDFGLNSVPAEDEVWKKDRKPYPRNVSVRKSH